jgi:hypothetical protein
VVDVYVDGSPVVVGLAYGQVSDYAVFSPERHSLKAWPSGAGAQGRPLLDGHLAALRVAEDYTLVFLGEPRNIHTLLLSDTTSAPAQDGAKIRFVHASPDAPAVDVALQPGQTLFPQVAFDRATPFVEVTSGMYDLVIRRAGQAQEIARAPHYTFTAGNLYTFVAMGLLDGTPGFMIMPLVESFRMCLRPEQCR